MNGSIKKEVYWYRDRSGISAREAGDLPPLQKNIETDVVIIGGGVAGLSAAKHFSFAGKKVVLLERSFCGSGASGKSSGMIAQDSELELSDLIRNLGVSRARKLWEFVGDGVEFIRDTVRSHAIACDYQEQDYVFAANDRGGLAKALREHKSRELLGYPSSFYNKKTVRNILGTSDYEGAVCYPGTFSIDSFRYVRALCRLCRDHGVDIFEQTAVERIEPNVVLTRDGYKVSAHHIVVCVDAFLPEFHRLKKDVFHIQTYLTASSPISADTVYKIFPDKKLLVNDSDIIYQYYRLTGDSRLLLGGGDYRTTYSYAPNRHPEHVVAKLTRYMRKKFPSVSFDVEYVWSGFLGVSKDLVPLIGRDRASPSTYYITASTGLAWASGAGKYIAEKILHGRDEHDELFSPYRRFPFDPFMRLFQRIITTPMAFGLSHAFIKYLR